MRVLARAVLMHPAHPADSEAFAVGSYAGQYAGWRRMTFAEFQAQGPALVAAHARGAFASGSFWQKLLDCNDHVENMVFPRPPS